MIDFGPFEIVIQAVEPLEPLRLEKMLPGLSMSPVSNASFKKRFPGVEETAAGSEFNVNLALMCVLFCRWIRRPCEPKRGRRLFGVEQRGEQLACAKNHRLITFRDFGAR